MELLSRIFNYIIVLSTVSNTLVLLVLTFWLLLTKFVNSCIIPPYPTGKKSKEHFNISNKHLPLVSFLINHHFLLWYPTLILTKLIASMIENLLEGFAFIMTLILSFEAPKDNLPLLGLL